MTTKRYTCERCGKDYPRYMMRHDRLAPNGVSSLCTGCPKHPPAADETPPIRRPTVQRDRALAYKTDAQNQKQRRMRKVWERRGY